MLKRFLVVGVLLGASLLVAGIGATLGVVLGTRTLVASAAAVKPVATISIASTGHLDSAPAVIAMGE
jgi:hypothetical protein